MSDQLTAREHDDMRDLLLAGTQGIRPAISHRTLISAGVAIALVAGAVGGILTTALMARQQDSLANPAPTMSQSAQPTPWPGAGEVVQGTYGEVSKLPAIYPPAPGTYVDLQPDPVLLSREFILGSGLSLEGMGIDVASAHGFQSVDRLHPWMANLADGSGRCILIRKNYSTGGWNDIVCDADGVPASVERLVDGSLVRFTLVGDEIRVYSVPR